jgi:hypothetical protein
LLADLRGRAIDAPVLLRQKNQGEIAALRIENTKGSGKDLSMQYRNV